MFGLKDLLARSKPIQYTSYVIVLALIVVAKLYPHDDSTGNTKEAVSKEASAVTETAPPIITTVDKVIDGDTVIAGGIRYRLAMIDAPETDQAFGVEATAFLRGLVESAEVTFAGTQKDQYGRTIANASINGVSIAEVMVENGYAWPYMVPNEFENQLYKLQDHARAGALGLWADPNPIRPSVFRETKHAN